MKLEINNWYINQDENYERSIVYATQIDIEKPKNCFAGFGTNIFLKWAKLDETDVFGAFNWKLATEKEVLNMARYVATEKGFVKGCTIIDSETDTKYITASDNLNVKEGRFYFDGICIMAEGIWLETIS